MAFAFPNRAGEFLEHYAHDARLRWSPADLAAQQDFVNAHFAGQSWSDWSTAEMSLALIQAAMFQLNTGLAGTAPSILLAGPAAELLPLSELLTLAAKHLDLNGQLVAILPCLRDNSPESALFAELSQSHLWPYLPAEELVEIAEDSGFQVNRSRSLFCDIPAFKKAVLENKLRFHGFREIFDLMEREGYDPMEVGWGEMRLSAEANN